MDFSTFHDQAWDNHVHGWHLGEWRAGAVFIEGLAALRLFQPKGASGQSLRRCFSSLALSAGDDGAAGLTTLSPSDRIQVGATAAANLAEHDAARSHLVPENRTP